MEAAGSECELADWSSVIAEVQRQFILRPDGRLAFATAIQRLCERSLSLGGAICEVLPERHGESASRRLATFVSGGRTSVSDHEGAPVHDVVDGFDDIFHAVIRARHGVAANSIVNGAASECTPSNGSTMESWLGLPLYCTKGELVGVAALANCPSGYDDDAAARLRPMCDALGMLIAAVQQDRCRRETEAALRASESRLRIFADHVAVHLLLHDGQGRVIDVNRHACDSLGYSREELIGMSPQEFDPTLTVDRIREYSARLTAGEALTFDSRNRRKDGSEFPVEVRISPLWIDGVPHGLSVASDITDRKLAEKRVRESEKRLKLALAASGMGVWEWDLDAGSLYWSPECYAVFGHREFDGRAETLRNLVHPDDRQACDDKIRLTIGAESDKCWECRVITDDGTLRWIASCAFVQRDECGRAVKLIGTSRDVTQEKLAASALLEAQRRLSLVLEGANVGTWDWDLLTDQVVFSSELKGHLGYRDEEPFTCYKDWESRVHPDDLPTALDRIRQALERRKQDYKSEFRMRHRNGSWRWILSLGSVMCDARDEPIRMLGVHIDITDQKQAEEALRESESRYRSFVDHATDALFLQDDTTRVVDVNRQACVSLGYERDELIGMLPFDFDPLFNAEKIAEARERLNRGETMTFDSEHRRKNGSIFPVEVRLRPFWSNGKRYHIGLVRDITERKRTEEALRESEARLRTLLENLDRVAVQAYEPDGTVTFWNRASELFYGYSADEAVGQNLVDLLYSDSTRERERRIMAEAIRTGKQPAADEIELVRRDGRKIIVLTSRVVHPRAGNDPEFFCFDVDITDRIRAEEELDRRQVELLHASRLSTVGQMVAEISHEVAQPLNAIGNFAAASERILEFDDGTKLDTLKEYVRAILDQNQRCITILGRLRNFSRRSPASRTECDIVQLLSDSVDLMSLELRRSQVKTALHLPDRLPPVVGDQIQLQQVIVNLLTNARDALQGQPVERRQIEIRGFTERGAIVVEVADAGSGLSNDAISHLFEPFFTTKQHGMGIGLSICQSILKEHGGRIEACSNSRGGATFRVRLPFARKRSHV